MKIHRFIRFLKHRVSYVPSTANVKMIIKKGTFPRGGSKHLLRKMVHQSISVVNLTTSSPLYRDYSCPILLLPRAQR